MRAGRRGEQHSAGEEQGELKTNQFSTKVRIYGATKIKMRWECGIEGGQRRTGRHGGDEEHGPCHVIASRDLSFRLIT